MINVNDIVGCVWNKSRNDSFQCDMSDDNQFVFEYMCYLLFYLLWVKRNHRLI